MFSLQKPSSSSQQPIRSRIETTVIYPRSTSPQHSTRTVYLLEGPKATNFRLDIPISNGIPLAHPEQYDYDTIESPQTFPGDLHVDWRTINLVLWSKCYCRYDQNFTSPLSEQELSLEINRLKDDLEKMQNKSKRPITLDTYHHVGHNSYRTSSKDSSYSSRLAMQILGIHKPWILACDSSTQSMTHL